MEQNRLFYHSRLRLAGWYAGVMGCILGLSGLGVYHVVNHAYRETIDQGLVSVADALDKSIEPVLQQPGHLQQLAQELSFKFCLTPADCLTKTTVTQPSISAAVEPVNYYIRLLERTGKPVVLGGLQLDQLPLTSNLKYWQTLTTSSGTHYRQICLPLHIQNHLWGYMQVGRSLNDLEQHLTTLRFTLVLGLPIAMILISWSSWWLAGLAMQPVYRSYQQMQQFTADAAHEFRTPIAAIQSTIEAAIKLQEKPNKPELLPVLKRQVTRLSQLVGDLLLLARIDQQQIAGQYSSCCLNDLISDLVEELAFLAVSANVSLSMQLQTQKPVYVLGNEEQLYRLVSNLIVNAIQATPSGGKVTLFLDSTEQYALIHVQDTGIGISLEHQAEIFNRFYRVQKDRSRHTGGSGLGLPIAQAIAQAHKGSIQVQSQLGKGSTFTVQLPLEQ